MANGRRLVPGRRDGPDLRIVSATLPGHNAPPGAGDPDLTNARRSVKVAPSGRAHHRLSMPQPLVFEPDPLQLPLPLLILLTVWFFYVGACIGSFMNVVIFRLPLGRSVVSPPSRCPQCGAFIRWHDNLPVLSWLLLRGRCRNCQTPISARYPIVEFLVGLIFMSLAMQAVVRGGPWWLMNVPPRALLHEPWWHLIMAYVYYVLLVCTLICAAYITWDGHRVPARLYGPAWIAGLVVPVVWSEVRPLDLSPADWLAAMLHAWHQGLLGLALGLVLGLIFDRVRDVRTPQGKPLGGIALALTTCGWLLGWRVVLVVTTIGLLIALVGQLLIRRRQEVARAAPLSGIATATTLLVLAGRLVFDRWQFVTSVRTIGLLFGSLLTTIVLALLLRWLRPPLEADPPTPPASDVIFP